MPERLMTEDIKKVLIDTFKGLVDDVHLELYTKKGVNDVFNDAITGLLKTISELSPKIKVSFYELGGSEALKRKVERSPTLLISPDRYRIRFTGAPLGEEGRSLIMSILMVSTQSVVINDDSLKRLSKLKESRDIKIFVSPTCPYCPQEVLYGVSSVIARGDLVSLEVIEILENRDIAESLGIMSVPQTFINDIHVAYGFIPEEDFIDAVINPLAPEKRFRVFGKRKEVVKKDLIIIGGGPAGLAGAIYAGRSGLDTLVIEKETLCCRELSGLSEHSWQGACGSPCGTGIKLCRDTCFGEYKRDQKDQWRLSCHYRPWEIYCECHHHSNRCFTKVP